MNRLGLVMAFDRATCLCGVHDFETENEPLQMSESPSWLGWLELTRKKVNFDLEGNPPWVFRLRYWADLGEREELKDPCRMWENAQNQRTEELVDALLGAAVRSCYSRWRREVELALVIVPGAFRDHYRIVRRGCCDADLDEPEFLDTWSEFDAELQSRIESHGDVPSTRMVFLPEVVAGTKDQEHVGVCEVDWWESGVLTARAAKGSDLTASRRYAGRAWAEDMEDRSYLKRPQKGADEAYIRPEIILDFSLSGASAVEPPKHLSPIENSPFSVSDLFEAVLQENRRQGPAGQVLGGGPKHGQFFETRYLGRSRSGSDGSEHWGFSAVPGSSNQAALANAGTGGSGLVWRVDLFEKDGGEKVVAEYDATENVDLFCPWHEGHAVELDVIRRPGFVETTTRLQGHLFPMKPRTEQFREGSDGDRTQPRLEKAGPATWRFFRNEWSWSFWKKARQQREDWIVLGEEP